MTTTRRDVVRAFEDLCSVLDKPVAARPGEPGAWELRHDDESHLVVVSETTDEGLRRFPLGPNWLPRYQFTRAVRVAIMAIHERTR